MVTSYGVLSLFAGGCQVTGERSAAPLAGGRVPATNGWTCQPNSGSLWPSRIALVARRPNTSWSSAKQTACCVACTRTNQCAWRGSEPATEPCARRLPRGTVSFLGFDRKWRSTREGRFENYRQGQAWKAWLERSAAVRKTDGWGSRTPEPRAVTGTEGVAARAPAARASPARSQQGTRRNPAVRSFLR